MKSGAPSKPKSLKPSGPGRRTSAVEQGPPGRRDSVTSSTTSGGMKKAGSKNRLNESKQEDKKSPTAQQPPGGGAQLKPIGPLLTSLVDVENVPLAVDLCHWIADITNSCIEIEQFFSCLQDGIVLCRLINAINKLRCEKSGDNFKQVHFRENIGNSVFFARINIETFIRWSKSFGLADPISVSDLIDHRDPMKAIENLYTIGRICAEMDISHPAVISMEVEHGYRYSEIVGLFSTGHEQLNKQEKAAKDGLRNLINIRELGALRSDVILSEQLANFRKKLTGKWTGKEIIPPTPEPLPPSPPPKEAKMGPWDRVEVDHLISLYREQIEEFGDDHIDFQRLSRKYTQRYQYRTPHQCWDKMYQLIERYQCDRNANRLFKRRVCSGPHHEQLHLCLGDTHIGKHLNAVYTGMVHPKVPTLPAYLECDPEERKEDERIGKEQLLEQTKLLRKINENLEAIRETEEKNASTNSALLCLLTHVLKGSVDLELELRGGSSGSATEPPTQNGSDKMSPADIDAKSLASDADIVPVDQPAC